MFCEFIEGLGLPEWAADAVCDSFAVLPFLFVIFLLVEFFEFYFSGKVNRFMKSTKKAGPIIGSVASLIPQCGFSVIASTLYVRRYITRGTLLAIYLATSDEAIPVLFSEPSSYHYILPVIVIKLVVAIFAGYLVDLVYKPENIKEISENSNSCKVHSGCCKHEITDKKSLIIHPVRHTLHIFMFILLITLILNYFINVEVVSTFYTSNITACRIMQPIVTAIVGLIPNCAISIAITLMLVKGTISFGAAMAGLMSNAGLGLLVLLRINKIKDTAKIIFILLGISILCGELLQFVK